MTHDTPPKRIWTFDRYVNGILMAEGVEIEKAETFEQAAKAAVRLASSGPKGEAPVLVLRDTSEAEAMVAAALREAAEGLLDWYTNVEDDRGPHMVVRALIPQPASAALDKLIAEAETRGMERAETHIAAIERLAISASIASCTCLTKTPDVTFHAADCRYVKLQYIIAQCEDFRAAKGDQT